MLVKFRSIGDFFIFLALPLYIFQKKDYANETKQGLLSFYNKASQPPACFKTQLLLCANLRYILKSPSETA